MNDVFEKGDKFSSNAIIKVIGVGGGGGNALNTMIESGLSGVEFIAANTDVQALQSNLAPIKIQLGRELTKGLGAGANPDTGRNAAIEDRAILQEVLCGADMVFVTGGMGGGTGTGAAPIIAQVARELGALTVGVVTKPFSFEGKRRKQQSEMGIQGLRQSVDTLITIPNQRLLSVAPQNMSMLEGFKLADEVLLNAVKGISDIINIPGRVNVDFADVRTIMSEMGMALMGIGTASGPNRATEAARAAINSPLLEDIDIEGATGILINITGTSSMTLHEISEASTLIQDAAHEDANIIFGAVIDETIGDCIRVTVIATGFDQARVGFPDVPQQPQGYPHGAPQQGQFGPISMQSQGVPQSPTHFTGLPSQQPRSPQGPPYPPLVAHANPQTGSSTYGGSPQGGGRPSHFGQREASHFNVQPSVGNQPTYGRSASGHSADNMGYANPRAGATSGNQQQPHYQTHIPGVAYTTHVQSQAGEGGEHRAETLQKQGGQAHSPASVEAGGTHSQASSFKTEEPADNSDTENTMKIVRELSDVEIDDSDFDTPAFMRRREDSQKN